MNSFKATRVVHQYTQTNPAPPKRFFLFSAPFESSRSRMASRLAVSLDRLIYSDSGVAELGWVFTTPKPPGAPHSAASEMTWIVTDYDLSAFRIAYVWKQTGVIITELRIQLEPAEIGTKTHIRYRYTGCRSWAIASSRARTVNGSKVRSQDAELGNHDQPFPAHCNQNVLQWMKAPPTPRPRHPIQ